MAQPGGDWTVQAADTIESVVGSIRDKTAVPLTTVARALVFGLIAGVVGVAALVMLTIGLVRAVIEVLPFDDHSRSVWVAEAGIGGLFLLLGLFVFAKRKPKTKE